jgi:hypothetical protein
MANPEKLRECFSLIAKTLTRATAGLNAREQLILQAGLSASHAEEALTAGDIDRAQAHFNKLMRIARQLDASKS